MLRTLTLWGLPALLLLAACSARAAEPTSDRLSDLQRIEKKLDDFLKQMADMDLRQRLTDGDLKRAETDIRELRRRVEELEGKLRSREDASIRRAFTPTLMSGPITLNNRTGLPATIVVDGVFYSLAPYEMATLPPRPAGPLTYEVSVSGWGVRQPLTTRTLGADRPFSIYINP